MNESIVQLQLRLLKEKVSDLDALISKNVSNYHHQVVKALYKKRINDGSYIKVAFIVGNGTIHFLALSRESVKEPNYYDSLWYYLNEVGELRYSTFDIPTWLTQIYVDSSIDSGDYYVTGYLTDNGKAIYYDQYIN